MPPRDIVVMSRETATPALRAGLRARGLYIPPALPRMDWGPPLIRETAPVHAAGDGEASGSEQPSPRPPALARPSTRPVAAQDLQAAVRENFHARTGGDDDLLPDEGLLDGLDDGYGEAEGDSTPSSPGAAEGGASYGPSSGAGYGGGGGAPYGAAYGAPGGAADYGPPPEPETRQLDVAQATAIAAAMAGGESTTQASHRAERLDLSEWGFLMRVVMIAGPDDPEPRRALDQLVPTIGEWLRNEVSQPARLEYDRRFRHEIEKQLSQFLTRHLGRFPVIKAELQYIE